MDLPVCAVGTHDSDLMPAQHRRYLARSMLSLFASRIMEARNGRSIAATGTAAGDHAAFG
jgi:hypothetical protein